VHFIGCVPAGLCRASWKALIFPILCGLDRSSCLLLNHDTIERRMIVDSAKSNLSVDLLIVGGGLVGLSLALSVARAGLRALVVDRDTPQNSASALFDGRVSSVAAGSVNMFKALGVWPKVSDGAQPIYQIRVSDGDSPRFLHYDSGDLDGSPMGYIVENRLLRRTLHADVKAEHRITWRTATSVELLDRCSYRVTALLSDGTSVDAPLVVAADGRDSIVRANAGIKVISEDYRQTGIVCTVAHDSSHEGIAHERFLRGGPFAILPMKGRKSSLVWTERTDLASELVKLDQQVFLDELSWRFGSFLGDLSLVSPVWSYPLRLTMAQDLNANRMVLVGDAAHAIHPIAGQGLNLGLRDAAVLAEVLSDARSLGLDIGDQETLSRYSRWRQFDRLTMVAVTDGLNRLFSYDSSPLRVVRDIGLSAVNSSATVKTLFQRHAMGLLGKLPKLLEGK
jgi:2-octaprenyl-6-methoxyphenol hydroxylase